MYDVAVIGGGSGGYAAAIRTARLRGKAVLIEAADMGGTCVNRGCIPSKIWLRSAELQQHVRAGHATGSYCSRAIPQYSGPSYFFRGCGGCRPGRQKLGVVFTSRITSVKILTQRTRLWLSPEGICFVGSSLNY